MTHEEHEEAVIAFTPAGRRIRPSNWIYRLMDIADAHWRGRPGSLPCGTCRRCSEDVCFVFPAGLCETHPDLVRDLLFCLTLLGVPEVTLTCPRNGGDSTSSEPAAA